MLNFSNNILFRKSQIPISEITDPITDLKSIHAKYFNITCFSFYWKKQQHSALLHQYETRRYGGKYPSH